MLPVANRRQPGRFDGLAEVYSDVGAGTIVLKFAYRKSDGTLSVSSTEEKIHINRELILQKHVCFENFAWHLLAGRSDSPCVEDMQRLCGVLYADFGYGMRGEILTSWLADRDPPDNSWQEEVERIESLVDFFLSNLQVIVLTQGARDPERAYTFGILHRLLENPTLRAYVMFEKQCAQMVTSILSGSELIIVHNVITLVTACCTTGTPAQYGLSLPLAPDGGILSSEEEIEMDSCSTSHFDAYSAFTLLPEEIEKYSSPVVLRLVASGVLLSALDVLDVNLSYIECNLQLCDCKKRKNCRAGFRSDLSLSIGRQACIAVLELLVACCVCCPDAVSQMHPLRSLSERCIRAAVQGARQTPEGGFANGLHRTPTHALLLFRALQLLIVSNRRAGASPGQEVLPSGVWALFAACCEDVCVIPCCEAATARERKYGLKDEANAESRRCLRDGALNCGAASRPCVPANGCDSPPRLVEEDLHCDMADEVSSGDVVLCSAACVSRAVQWLHPAGLASCAYALLVILRGCGVLHMLPIAEVVTATPTTAKCTGTASDLKAVASVVSSLLHIWAHTLALGDGSASGSASSANRGSGGAAGAGESSQLSGADSDPMRLLLQRVRCEVERVLSLVFADTQSGLPLACVLLHTASSLSKVVALGDFSLPCLSVWSAAGQLRLSRPGAWSVQQKLHCCRLPHTTIAADLE
eukprot:Rmarinus@m.17808